MFAFALVGAAIAVITYIPLTKQVWKKEITQNFATYFLWGLLDTVASASTYFHDKTGRDHGNWVLPAIYVVCCFAVLVAILRSRTFSWGWKEYLVSALVLISIGVWYFVSGDAATLTASLGVVIASVPLVVDSWEEPHKAPLELYVGFTIANFVSIFAGKEWTIAERGYSTICSVTTLVFVIAVYYRRRYAPKEV